MHGETTGDAKQLVERASFILFEFQAANKVEILCKDGTEPLNRTSRWKPPPLDQLKLNVDASVVNGVPKVGIGGVIRGADGGVFGSFAQQIPGIFEPFMAELLAIRSGLIFARDSGLKICIFESDFSLAVRAIHDGSSSGPGGSS